jgi:hypothetical protein
MNKLNKQVTESIINIVKEKEYFILDKLSDIFQTFTFVLEPLKDNCKEIIFIHEDLIIGTTVINISDDIKTKDVLFTDNTGWLLDDDFGKELQQIKLDYYYNFYGDIIKLK